jgi:PilZ domain
VETWERRYCPRFRLRVPVKFRCSDPNTDLEEHTVETSNISRTGLFFISRIPLQIGSTINLSLRLPVEIASDSSESIGCVGHVVRKQMYSDGSVGYGVQTNFRPPSISPSPTDSASDPVSPAA